VGVAGPGAAEARPLFDTPDGTAIPQIGGARKLGFDRELTALIDHFAGQNQLSGFRGIRESGRLNKTETGVCFGWFFGFSGRFFGQIFSDCLLAIASQWR